MGRDASKLKDRDYKGEDFDVPQDLANGPRVDRKCTNVLCYIIFVVFNLSCLGFAIYGYAAGNVGMLMAPVDSSGNICGYDSGYENYPYGYIWNIQYAAANPTQFSDYMVCVEECPATSTSTLNCKNTVESTQEGGCNSLYSSQRYGSNEAFSYCIPIEDTIPASIQSSYDALWSSFLQTGAGSFVLDIYNARWVILTGMALSFVYSLVYIKMMDYAANICAWVSVVLVQFSFIGLGLASYFHRQSYLEQSNSSSDDSYAIGMNIFTWTMWTLAAIYYLCVACSFKSLNIAIGVLEAASDFVADTFRIIFVPIIFFFIGIAVFCIWISGIVCCGSVGEISGDAGWQTKTVVWSDATGYMVWAMIFGLIWIISFIIACNDFVIIVSAITWYFSKKTDEGDGKASICTGFEWIFKYHCGSLALGSCILAIIWCIRALFEYAAEKLQDATGDNCCTKCLIWTCRCCLDCFDRFMRYLNENAYIYMALTGDPFCESAIDVFCLMLKNAAKFGFVNSIGSVFAFLAKACISSFTTITCYWLMGYMIDPEDAVSSPLGPLIIIGLFGYLAGAIFVSVFETGANTILQCFLVDYDIARQTGHLEQSHIPDGLDKFLEKFGGQDIKQIDQTKSDQLQTNLLS